MKGRRLWMRVAVHGGTIPVYVEKGALNVDGCECDAYFEPETPKIVVRSSENVTGMKQKLFHELLHVCFAAHTGDEHEEVFASKNRETRHKREERLIRFLEPIFFDMLSRNHWLRFPNPPRFP